MRNSSPNLLTNYLGIARCIFLCRLTLLFFGIVSSAFASESDRDEPSHNFQAGIEAYEKGDYATAKAKFLAALEEDETAAARHNLGLTELQLDQPAQAVWQLERALLMDPFNKDYRNKLNLVREQLGISEISVKWYYQLSQVVSIRVWLIVATASFWILIAAIVLPLANTKTTSGRIRALQFCSVLTLIFSLAALWLSRTHLKTGIVLSDETTTLHAAAANAAPEIGFARPGEQARVLNEYNDFYQVKTESSATGWISENVFRPLTD